MNCYVRLHCSSFFNIVARHGIIHSNTREHDANTVKPTILGLRFALLGGFLVDIIWDNLDKSDHSSITAFKPTRLGHGLTLFPVFGVVGGPPGTVILQTIRVITV